MSTLDTLNTPTPVRLLDKVELVGHPFHGLVHSGALTLPNDDTLIYRQPSTADAWALHLAGVPELTRTTEQLAQDAVLGHQWLHRVVLSGHVPQIYGKPLVGNVPAWLWRDSAGVVWQLSLSALSTYQTQIRITYRKFGRFGEASYPPVNVDLTHAIDSGAVEVDLKSLTDLFFINEGQIRTAPRICDINEDGSSVIVGLYHVPDTTVYQGLWQLPKAVERAAGFVQIDVSAGSTAPTLSLTTLRNHQQTLGSITIEDERTPAGGQADLPTDGLGNPLGAVTEVRSLAIAGRVVSMYFDDADVPREITISYSRYSESIREYQEWSVTYDSSTYTTRDRRTPLVSTWQISLEINGAQVATESFDTLPAPFTVDTFGFVDGLFYFISKAGTRSTYYEVVFPDGPFVPTTLAEGYVTSAHSIPQNGLWGYSKKLWCLFRISATGLVTWSDAFAPGASAAAQAPASGGWTSGSSFWSGGPTTWYRAQDPITGAISDAYSSIVCFV